MAQLRGQTDQPAKPIRTHATIIGETPNARAREVMANLCGAKLPWFDLFGTRRAWDEEQAEASAWMWLSTRINETAPLLLLGARVCKAFGLPPFEWLEWYRSPLHAHPLIAFPHPTRSRWIRSPENAMAAGLLAANVAHNKLPNYEWQNREESA